MTPPILRLLTLAVATTLSLPAQQWNDETLLEKAAGFQITDLPARLEQVGRLVESQDDAYSALVARVHGDHREYSLKIERLLNELCDPNWRVRENAERALVEVGGRAIRTIEMRRENYKVLEQHIRCDRILASLAAKGDEQEVREQRLLQGLVRTSLYVDAKPELLRALRSALGHTDAPIAGAAVRALGRHGTDDEADAVANMIAYKGGVHRSIAISALGRMPSAKALAHCRELLLGNAEARSDGPLAGIEIDQTEAMRIVRALRSRKDTDAKALLADLAKHPDPVIKNGAAIVLTEASEEPAEATLILPGAEQLKGKLGKWYGDSILAHEAFPGLPTAELSLSDCATIEFPQHEVQANTATMVFLNQGSRISGEIITIDAESIKLASPLFGELTLPRGEIQGIALDPTLKRLVGASVDHDRVRLNTDKFVDGKIASLSDGKIRIEDADGKTTEVAVADVRGMIFTRPRLSEEDPLSYTRVDLSSGERLIGFVAESNDANLAVSVPLIGASVLPWKTVSRVELGVGGGAMWGFTLIADYSDNQIIEVDDQGRVTFKLEDIFGAWDAECLDNGNLLITEFSVSRVQEVNREGKTVWQFEDLKNPYDADRLPNGNTLIADTFASRVIEINPAGEIVWRYDQDIRPFDCDRLPNGNTLIADVLKDRVIEVTPDGQTVWEGKNLPNAHDADRLPNGNTLVTLRNKGVVVELDRDGKVVFELTGLSSPSDADRLPNGNTIVAENTRAREFDRHGSEVWKKDMTWAVEVNRY
ncbi:MAG: hypothetical protein AB8H80_03855 [Planctomycetota bacterium]